MATFNEFCATLKARLKKGFRKVSNEVEKAADTASLHIKLNTIKSKLSELYEELGKLTYEKVHDDVAQDGAARVEELIATITEKLAEQKEIRDELDRRKAEKEAKHEGEKTEYEATAEAPVGDTPAEGEPVELPPDTEAKSE